MFDLFTLGIIGVFSFLGLQKGLIVGALRLIGLVCALFVGTKYFYLGALLMKGLFSAPQGVYTVVGFVIIFVIVYFAFQLIGSILKRAVMSLRIIWLDRSAGLLFGALKGAFIVAVFLWIVSVFPELGIKKRIEASSTTYPVFDIFKNGAIKALHIEDELDSLNGSLRRLFLLEKREVTGAQDSTIIIK